MAQVKQTFAPEFINRLDEIIIFDELTQSDLEQIIDLQIDALNKVIKKRDLVLRLSDEARNWLIEKTCGDRSYGARPLKRALQRYVEDELSEALIQQTISEGSRLEAVIAEDRLTFRLTDAMSDSVSDKEIAAAS